MKRKEVSIENAPCVWHEAHVMQVFKVVAFYGFDKMQDISMFCSLTREFYDWANRNVIVRALVIRFCKQKEKRVYYGFFAKSCLPTSALLKLHNSIELRGISFKKSVIASSITEVSYCAILNDALVAHVRAGKYFVNNAEKKTFASSWLTVRIEPVFEENNLERLKKIKFYASKL